MPTSPVRILFGIAHLKTGGAVRQLLELASRLDRDRFHPEVVAYTDGGLAEAFEAAQVPVYLVGRAGKLDPKPYLQVHRLLKDRKPALIHSWMFSANLLMRTSALMLRDKSTKPVIISSERTIDKRSPFRWLIDRHLAKITNAVVVNSEATAQHLQDHMVGVRDLIKVIPNGIDCDRFSPPSMKRGATRHDPVRLICVGRITPDKGQDILIRAVGAARDAGLDLSLRLVGDSFYPNETRFKEDLNRLIDTLGLRKAVELSGFREDIPQLLGESDIFVLPSRTEVLSNAVLEAMATGLPVISSNVGGMQSLLGNSDAGILVPPNDVRSLGNAIIRLAADDGLRERLAHRGGDIALAHSMDAMVKSTTDLYDRLLFGEPTS